MAAIEQAYTKMLNDIVLLIVGGIGGIVGKRAVGAITQAVNPTPPPSPAPAPAAPAPTTPPVPAAPVQNTFGALPVWTNPPLDESWSPPPPPTTPPSLEDDSERELQAEARASVK